MRVPHQLVLQTVLTLLTLVRVSGFVTLRSPPVGLATVPRRSKLPQLNVADCAWCNGAIQAGETYYQMNGRIFHSTCYANHVAPRCDCCHEAIQDGPYITENNKMYHESCYKECIALRCDLCNAVIEGKYITTVRGEAYCSRHQKEVPECNYCGRFMGDRHNKGGRLYHDGRNVCNICLKSAVSNDSQGRSILQEVKRRLHTLGIQINTNDIPLHLVDKDQLNYEHGSEMNHHSSSSGLCKHYYEYDPTGQRGNQLFNQRFEIYILESMPEIHFIKTVAHELMHVWQYINCPLNNQPSFCEGSCDYAAWLVLGQYLDRSDDAAYQMKALELNENPVYGTGFRQVRQLAHHRGHNGWLEVLQTQKDMPRGFTAQ